MVENKKADESGLLVIIVAILTVITFISQIMVLVNQWQIFEYLMGFVLIRFVSFRVIGLLFPLIVLVTLFVNKPVVPLATVAGHYALFAILSLSGILYSGTIQTSNFIVIVFYLLMAMMPFLLMIKAIPTPAAVISCSAVTVMWLLIQLYQGGFQLLSLINYIAPAAMTICLMLLMDTGAAGEAEAYGGNKYYGGYDRGTLVFEEKNIAVCIILSFLTAGIYQIFWLADIVRNVHKLHGSDDSVVPEVVLMMFIPFYAIYWMYKNGKQMYEDSRQHNGNMEDNAVVYMVLTLLGFGLISYALIQHEFNKFVAGITSPDDWN